jgi:hypothetical protein
MPPGSRNPGKTLPFSSQCLWGGAIAYRQGWRAKRGRIGPNRIDFLDWLDFMNEINL